MTKFIKSNWREILAAIIIIPLLLVAILALGSKDVSESGPISAAVSLAVTLIGGVTKFVVCLALAWAGLAVTFPEAGKFVFGQSFDIFWNQSPISLKGLIVLIAAAVLAIVAALCMASS